MDAIEHFVQIVNCRPLVVMDRGFACPAIIQHLAQNSHPFIIRIKDNKQFKDEHGVTFKARDAKSNDMQIAGYGFWLRLVISDKPASGGPSWYLITNLVDEDEVPREYIVSKYYYRFEIEEFFKDAKWLQGLEHTHFKKQESVETLLWFVLLGWWCLDAIQSIIASFPLKHPKAKLSFSRYIYELLQREKNLYILSTLIGIKSL
jgi:uncharacterized membrane protein YccF (DUF307 family)